MMLVQILQASLTSSCLYTVNKPTEKKIQANKWIIETSLVMKLYTSTRLPLKAKCVWLNHC